MRINNLLEKRYSPRAFDPNKVPSSEEISMLLKAAQWAPSAFNEQPWRFIYALNTNEDTFNLLMEPLVKFNKDWVKTAPMLILTMVKKHFDNGNINTHNYYDLGLAMSQLCLQATEMGMYVHHMTGFDKVKAKELLKVPDELDIVSYVAIGYKGDKGLLPEYIAEMEDNPRSRKELDSIVFNGDWEKLL